MTAGSSPLSALLISVVSQLLKPGIGDRLENWLSCGYSAASSRTTRLIR